MRLLRDRIDIVGQSASVTTSACSPSITERALLARSAVGLVDLHIHSGLGFPLLGESGVDVLIQFPVGS